MENLGRTSAAEKADHLLGRTGSVEEANTDLWYATNHNGRKLHNKPLPIKQAANELFKYEAATGNQGSLVHFDQAKKGDFAH